MATDVTPDEEEPIFAIAVAAELAGMHPQTLRQYDRLGLVTPGRTQGGSRRYSLRHVKQLREVAALSAEGMSLPAISRLVELENTVRSLRRQVSELEGRRGRTGRMTLAAATTPRIVVLGSANVDLVVRQPRRAEPGETVFGTSFQTGPGGKGLNQAVAAARAGGGVAFIGAVGDDAFGAQLRTTLEAEGIDTRALRTTAAPTGIAQITVTDDGENSITVVAGANGLADLRDDERTLVAEASHLVVQLERPEPLLIEALRHARAHGVTTVLTPAPARAPLTELIGLADVLVPNAGEAALLAGVPDVEAAAVSLSRAAHTVVVTRGADGAVVAQEGEIVSRVPARRATPIDTTGAGDTFTGVLVAGLSQGAPLGEALAAAAAAASITVTRPGAADSMPTRAEIDAALA